MAEKIPHSVDGIEEYDNPIPRWLMWLLYIAIVFAVAYWILYPGWWKGATGWNQARMYEEEMAEAAVKYASLKNAPVDLNALFADQSAIADGKEIFAQNCTPCHGADAHGAIGPNLTDATWIYGSKPEEIVKTITSGTANGMPPWGTLGAKKIADVAAFVKSLSETK